MDLLEGLYGDQLENVNRINKYYDIYEGKQEWETNSDLDYTPTKKITNYVKKLIDAKSRFMFGKEPFFDLRTLVEDEDGSTNNQTNTQDKEDLLHQILKDNRFHGKLLKAMKDSLIGGRVAIKLWASKEVGLKLIFSPAQEFFPQYNIDDVDELEKVTFLYALNDEEELGDQRFKKQEWEMLEGRCILNEGIYDGNGDVVELLEVDYNTELDFIPVVIVQNGGLTGETEGVSDVEQLWDNQNAYNRLTSDDIDSLRFNMFPQRVATDADGNSLENMKIAPGALVDLQTDLAHSNQGRQAKLETVESGFSYADKYIDTVNRIKNDMFDIVDVPNVGIDQLSGLMTSGKSMRALYWGLIAVCDEMATEWNTCFEDMVDSIFKMVDAYNLYDSRKIAKYETTLQVIREYPIEEDALEARKINIEEVLSDVRSRANYMKLWDVSEDIDTELEAIQLEKQKLEQDTYTRDLLIDIGEDVEDTEEGD